MCENSAASKVFNGKTGPSLNVLRDLLVWSAAFTHYFVGWRRGGEAFVEERRFKRRVRRCLRLRALAPVVVHTSAYEFTSRNQSVEVLSLPNPSKDRTESHASQSTESIG